MARAPNGMMGEFSGTITWSKGGIGVQLQSGRFWQQESGNDILLECF